MASPLEVLVQRVITVTPHPNADTLDLVTVGGFQCVAKRNDDGTPKYKAGDLVVYIPPDVCLTRELADRLGVTSYLDEKIDKTGAKALRVRAKKFRGEPSWGILMDVPQFAKGRTGAHYPSYPADAIVIDEHQEIEGTNVADVFGITKFEPPVKAFGGLRGVPTGDILPEDLRFSAYTSIKNFRHYPNIFDGHDVVAVEKLHGTNSRVGIVGGEWMAGSHSRRRKNPVLPNVQWDDAREQAREPGADGQPVFNSAKFEEVVAAEVARIAALPLPDRWWNDDRVAQNVYWFPLSLPAVRLMIQDLSANHHQVILFGEIVGPGIFFPYGVPQGQVGYYAFDLLVDGKYLDYDAFLALCSNYGVPVAPCVYRGPIEMFHRPSIEGKSMLDGTHMMEGVVIRPTSESTHPKTGRAILKLISDQYMLAKDGGKVEDATDE